MIRRTILLMTCVVFIAAVPAEAFDINLAVGADFGGDFDLGEVSLSSNTGYNLGLEIAFDIPIIELGAGLEYGFSRSASIADLDASYYQIYAIGVSSSGRSTSQVGSVTRTCRCPPSSTAILVVAAAGVSAAASSSSEN